MSKKIKNLEIKNIIFISVLMFLFPIIKSTQMFLSSENLEETLFFTPYDNWNLVIYEVAVLILVFSYLKFYNFDFSQWNIKINFISILEGIFLFLIIAIIFDVYFMTFDYFIDFLHKTEEVTVIDSIDLLVSRFDISLIVISILNGFFEELFFLGICLSICKKHVKKVVLFSLLIRYAIHTYQGNMVALGIGLILGMYYFIIYNKMNKKNLFPFFLSHALADIFGLGLLGYITQL